MEIVTYPHPTLRYKSKPIKRVDAELKAAIRGMFDAMYEAKGIGLAANQVNLPFRLFVVNLEADPKTSEELVFINPVLSRPKASEEQDEGCLSFPDLHAPVTRPKRIHVNAYGLDGQEISADLDGMLSRAVQHEFDHLDGILFIDRMSVTTRGDVQETLEEFETDYRSRRETGEVLDDKEIALRLAEWERRYC